jgi:hypothetical protein
VRVASAGAAAPAFVVGLHSDGYHSLRQRVERLVRPPTSFAVNASALTAVAAVLLLGSAFMASRSAVRPDWRMTAVLGEAPVQVSPAPLTPQGPQEPDTRKPLRDGGSQSSVLPPPPPPPVRRSTKAGRAPVRKHTGDPPPPPPPPPIRPS